MSRHHRGKRIHAGLFHYRGYVVEFNEEAPPSERWWVREIGHGLHDWPDTYSSKKEAYMAIDGMLDETYVQPARSVVEGVEDWLFHVTGGRTEDTLEAIGKTGRLQPNKELPPERRFISFSEGKPTYWGWYTLVFRKRTIINNLVPVEYTEAWARKNPDRLAYITNMEPSMFKSKEEWFQSAVHGYQGLLSMAHESEWMTRRVGASIPFSTGSLVAVMTLDGYQTKYVRKLFAHLLPPQYVVPLSVGMKRIKARAPLVPLALGNTDKHPMTIKAEAKAIPSTRLILIEGDPGANGLDPYDGLDLLTVAEVRQLIAGPPHGEPLDEALTVGDKVYATMAVPAPPPIGKGLATPVAGMVGTVVSIHPRKSNYSPVAKVRWEPRGNVGSREVRMLVRVADAVAAGAPGSDPRHLTEEVSQLIEGPPRGELLEAAGLRQRLNDLRSKMARTAQKVVDEWEVDEDGLDDEFGGGGACDKVGSQIGEVLMHAGIDYIDGGQDGDDHAWLIAFDSASREAFGVNIPAGVYETGGGYSWSKIPGAQIRPLDVDVWPIDYEDIAEAVDDLEEATARIGRRKVRLSPRAAAMAKLAYKRSARRRNVMLEVTITMRSTSGLSGEELRIPGATAAEIKKARKTVLALHDKLDHAPTGKWAKMCSTQSEAAALIGRNRSLFPKAILDVLDGGGSKQMLMLYALTLKSVKLTEGKAIGTAMLKANVGERDRPLRVMDPSTIRRSIRQAGSNAPRALQQVYAEARLALPPIVSRLSTGVITLADAQLRSAVALKRLYERMRKIGRRASGLRELGADEALYREEERWFRSAVREELGYWNTFLKEVVDGRAGNISKRIDAYIDALRFMYEAARVQAMPDNVLLHWVGPRDERLCKGCAYLMEMSPFVKDNLPAVPRDGSTSCLTHCFLSGTMTSVLTEYGWKKLKDVQVGELVLGHDQKFHRVVSRTWDHEESRYYRGVKAYEVVVRDPLFHRTKRFTVTPDHEWVKPDGSKIRTEELTVGASLMGTHRSCAHCEATFSIFDERVTWQCCSKACAGAFYKVLHVTDEELKDEEEVINRLILVTDNHEGRYVPAAFEVVKIREYTLAKSRGAGRRVQWCLQVEGVESFVVSGGALSGNCRHRIVVRVANSLNEVVRRRQQLPRRDEMVRELKRRQGRGGRALAQTADAKARNPFVGDPLTRRVSRPM